MDEKIKRKIANLHELVMVVKNDKIIMKDCIDMHQFCAFWGSYDVLSYFEDIVVLVHGPFGCLGNRHYLNPMGSHNECDNKPHLSTHLTEKDIIFGGEKKLLDCINEVNTKYPDKRIAILTNCCADIIGDDVEGCVESLPMEIKNKTVFLNTGGYSGKSYRRGTEMAFKLLASKVVDDNIEIVKNKNTHKKVNLFLRRWIWDPVKSKEINEITRMLNLLNVEINEVFNNDMNFEKLKKMQEADLNIALCLFFAHGFFDELYDQYNIPFSSRTTPIGLKASIDWLKEIAMILEIDEDIENFSEVQELEQMRRNLIEKIGHGRDCVIWNQTGDRLIALLKFAIELEMKPIIVGVEPSIIKEKMHLFQKEVLDRGLNAKVFASKYIEEVQLLINELDDPIIFCNNNYFPQNKVFKYRFCHNTVYGFNGVRQMYNELSDLMDKEVNKYSFFVED